MKRKHLKKARDHVARRARSLSGKDAAVDDSGDAPTTTVVIPSRRVTLEALVYEGAPGMRDAYAAAERDRVELPTAEDEFGSPTLPEGFNENKVLDRIKNHYGLDSRAEARRLCVVFSARHAGLEVGA